LIGPDTCKDGKVRKINRDEKDEWNAPPGKEVIVLILTRRVSEKLVIGENVTVTVLAVKGNQVRIGIEAPSDVMVNREEVYQRIVQEQIALNGMNGNGRVKVLEPKAKILDPKLKTQDPMSKISARTVKITARTLSLPAKH